MPIHSIQGAKQPITERLSSLVSLFPYHFGPSLNELIEKCSIVRWFDADTLVHFAHIKEPENALRTLRKFAFIENRGEHLAVHDLVRDRICQFLAAQSPNLYRDLHRQAWFYYRHRMKEARPEQLQQLMIELTYHSVRADEEEGVSFLDRTLSNTCLTAPLFYQEALLAVTDDLVLSNANQELLGTWRT